MRDIYEIFKKHGIEVDEAKKEDFEKEFHQNYKTVNEVEGLNRKVENLRNENQDLKAQGEKSLKAQEEQIDKLKKELEDAGTNKEKLEKLNSTIADLQKANETAQSDFDKRLAAQQKEFAVKEATNKLQFSSNSAKKLFTQEMLQKDLNIDKDGKILGFDDLVDDYKKTDADAFVKENVGDDSADDGDEDSKPKFGGKTGRVEDPKPDSSVKERPVIW